MVSVLLLELILNVTISGNPGRGFRGGVIFPLYSSVSGLAEMK